MEKTNVEIINAILTHDNKKLKKLLSGKLDADIFKFYEGCITYIALEADNIEAAKVIIEASCRD